MHTIAVEARRDHFLISTDQTKLDIPFIHHWLSTVSYWAQGRSLETVRRSIENSLSFGVYDGLNEERRNYGGFETLQNPERWMARIVRK